VRLDLASVALSLAAILPFVYGLKELARHGWQPLPLITNPQFSISLGGLLSCAMLNGATMVFTAQHFQLVDGLSPLQAGLAMLPGMVTSIVSVQVAPQVARSSPSAPTWC